MPVREVSADEALARRGGDQLLLKAIIELLEDDGSDELTDDEMFARIPPPRNTPLSVFQACRIELHRIKNGRVKLTDMEIRKRIQKIIDRMRPPDRVDIRMDETHGVDWLVDQWIPRGMAGMLTGQGGVGKSRLTLQLAYAMTTGWGWEHLGLPNPGRVYKVMVAGYEDTPDQQVSRLWQIARTVEDSPSAVIPPNLTILDNHHLRRTGPVWGQPYNLQSLGEALHGWDTVIKHAGRQGMDILIIDPLSYAFASNENDRNEVGRFTNALAAFCEEYTCTVLLVSHPPKDSTKSYSGSTGWEGGVRFAMRLDSPAEPRIDRRTKEGRALAEEFVKSLSPNRKDLVMFKSNHSLIQDPVPYTNRYGVWIANTVDEHAVVGAT